MLRRVDKYIWRLVDACLLVAIVAMVVTIGFQVISRIINSSAPWTEELSRLLFIWTAFLGMATGFRNAEHPRVDVFVEMLPARLSRPLHLLTPVCALIFFCIVGYYGYLLVLQQMRFGETSPAIGIGMWIVTLPVVLSAALAILGAIMACVIGPQADYGQAVEEATTGKEVRP